jgi:hypothetical protein
VFDTGVILTCLRDRAGFTMAYCILGSQKEGYLSRVGKVKPTLLTFPTISLPSSGLQVDPREPSRGEIYLKRGASGALSIMVAKLKSFQQELSNRMKSYR